jgi:hypothetical protein
LEKTSREPWDELPPALPNSKLTSSSQDEPKTKTAPHSEEIRRIEVDEEDRLAFRVGVNFITLVVIAASVYFLIRYLWG